MSQPPLILASKSPQRARLLTTLGVPFTVKPANVDETPLKHEAPLAYVKRIALAKAAKISAENPGSVVVAADTPVILGRRILQTPETSNEAAQMLTLQSGRRVHIPTVVAVADAQGKLHHKSVDSWIKFKPFTAADIAAYLQSDKWHGSGGLCIEVAEVWATTLHGSYSGIIGLPLYETSVLLARAGLKINPFSNPAT
jgi:septum formation protein